MNNDEIKQLSDQRDFEQQFNSWFRASFQKSLEDNRRRYRMQLIDAEERKSRGLSALPSTKSTSAVDRAVEKAIMEYHGEPDAITFTAQLSGDIQTDQKAKWLTEIFKYRADKTFPFPVWNAASLTAGLVDGLEAALVWWKKESYTEKIKVKHAIQPDGSMVEVDDEMYAQIETIAPQFAHEMEKDEEQVLVDSWWIDQLKPGEDILWDIKAPLLDLNLGSKVLVKLRRTLGEVEQLHEYGVFDKKYKAEYLKSYQKNEPSTDQGTTAGDTQGIDLDDLNRCEVWLYFAKEKGRWTAEFSIEGKLALSKPKPVNDVFFGGRKVNKLPVVMGTTKLKLWEAIGRGIPETIAPIEDEWTDHRNNLNDAAKFALQGRHRLDPGSDVDIDSLLNERVFYAKAGEVETVETDYNIQGSLRAADSINADLNELLPVGMESRQVVPRGVDKTLGAVQLALGASNEKMSVALMVRNFTFFRPLLYLIAQMELAFETDETIARIAAQKVKTDATQDGQPHPFQVPQVMGQVDFSELDLDFDIQINAGLGSIPRQQKLQNMSYLAQVAQNYGIPIDAMKMFKQGTVLLGFDEDQFIDHNPKQPSPPAQEMKATLNIDLALLPVQLQSQLLDAFLRNSQSIDAKFTGDAPKPPVIPQGDMAAPMMTGEPNLG